MGALLLCDFFLSIFLPTAFLAFFISSPPVLFSTPFHKSHGKSKVQLTPTETAPRKSIDLAFIRQHVTSILRSSPISYIRGAKLRGGIFVREMGSELASQSSESSEPGDGNSNKEGSGEGIDRSGGGGNKEEREERVCVDTGFYVDHTETREVLRGVRGAGREWVLGEVGEGEEYAVLVEGGGGGEGEGV